MPSSALCIACDEAYLPYACVAAKQALAVAKRPLPAVIVCDNVSIESVRKGQAYLGDDCLFVDASARLRDLHLNTAHMHKAAYLRLFIDLLPEMTAFSKVIYMDCDVQFIEDPRGLLDVRLDAAPILAAHDMRYLSSATHRSYLPMPPDSPYFNSGVLVLDLDRIRREGQLERARRFASDFPHLCRNHDQDALNVAFANGWQTMDWRWNAVSIFSDRFPHDRIFARHFSGHKPWGARKAGIEPRFIEDWRRNLLASPWPGHFREMAIVERIRATVGPYGYRLETGVKQMLYAGLFGKVSPRRARRAQLLRNLETVLSRIEDDAANLRPARRNPEFSLID
jgi:lipopolysaccharide biosynthesis glycosyltransferase